MFSKDIGIDLGTVNILIYIKGEGIALDEPSVVVVDEESKKIIAFGKEADEMLGRTPGKIKAIRPMKDGVIADFELIQGLLEYLLKKVSKKVRIGKPRIIICCPSNTTEVEKNAIKDAAEKIGAKKVFLEEEPKVAALGAGLDISKPVGNMIVDIGGGTTDIAVLSLGDIVTSSSIKIAGNTFDKEIIEYVKNNYKLLIGEKTAENIKISLNEKTTDKNNNMKIRGRDLVGGLPKTINISKDEIEKALKPSIDKIVSEIKKVLEETPPELSADIIDKGIMLTGGGAKLYNLAKILKEELSLEIKIAEEPLECVARGTGILLEQLDLIDRLL